MHSTNDKLVLYTYRAKVREVVTATPLWHTRVAVALLQCSCPAPIQKFKTEQPLHTDRDGPINHVTIGRR